MSIIILIIATNLYSQIKMSGFGQAKYESDEFSIPKARVFLAGQLIDGILNTKVRYELYVDMSANPKKIGFAPGFASLILSVKDLPIEFVAGQTLDPATYQFPGPSALLVLKYPKALMNDALSLGAYVRYKDENAWLMVGYVNGDEKFTIKKDVTARGEYILPFGVSVDAIYRGGNDDMKNRREYYGASLTYKNGLVWLNGGMNWESYMIKKKAQWLWGTYSIVKDLQLAGLYETNQIDNELFHGWAAGLNIIMSEKTVARIGYQKRAEKDGFEGWGIIFQQMF